MGEGEKMKNPILDELKSSLKNIRNGFALAGKELNSVLIERNKINEAENRLASVSEFGFEFVFTFRPTAKFIAAARPKPNTETYIELIEEAIFMLAVGIESNDVLEYFDRMLKNEFGGKRG